MSVCVKHCIKATECMYISIMTSFFLSNDRVVIRMYVIVQNTSPSICLSTISCLRLCQWLMSSDSSILTSLDCGECLQWLPRGRSIIHGDQQSGTDLTTLDIGYERCRC
jgi:hypothetical protein